MLALEWKIATSVGLRAQLAQEREVYLRRHCERRRRCELRFFTIESPRRRLWRQNDRLREWLPWRTGEEPTLGSRGVSTRFRADALELVITFAAKHIEDLLPRSKLRALEKNWTGFACFLVRQDAIDLNQIESPSRCHNAIHGNGKKRMPGVSVGVIEGHDAIIHSFVKDGQIHCKTVDTPFTTESITRMLDGASRRQAHCTSRMHF